MPMWKASTLRFGLSVSAASGSRLDGPREKVEEWRTAYNEVRPHSAIGDRTPLSLIHPPRQEVEVSTRPEILS